MKSFCIAVVMMAMFLGACSLPPERAVTKDELYKTGIYNYYTIKESPESVLAAINREGEVVLDAKFKDRQVQIKILATNTGLKLFFFDR
jgi:hypothetical protein